MKNSDGTDVKNINAGAYAYDNGSTDEQIARACKHGDLQAFELLVQRYQKQVLHLCYRIVNDVHAAEDLAQECFLKLYLNIEHYRGDAAFKTWFYSITINVCRTYLKKRFVIDRLRGAGLYPRNGDDKIEDKPGHDEHDILLKLQLEAAIARLPVKQREAFVLKHVEGMKISEIAVIQQTAEGTVKAHLFRAVKALQKYVGNE
ncbi:MAG: RNA polymerase sigma factor [Elusimicrobiota bacterium]